MTIVQSKSCLRNRTYYSNTRQHFEPYRDIPAWVISNLDMKPHVCFVSKKTYRTFGLVQLEEYFGEGKIDYRLYENGVVLFFK